MEGWVVLVSYTYRDDVSARRQSPIQVLTGPDLQMVWPWFNITLVPIQFKSQIGILLWGYEANMSNYNVVYNVQVTDISISVARFKVWWWRWWLMNSSDAVWIISVLFQCSPGKVIRFCWIVAMQAEADVSLLKYMLILRATGQQTEYLCIIFNCY